MKSSHFTNQLIIQAPLEEVYTRFKEPKNYPQFHPFVFDVQELERGCDEQGREFLHFEAQEKITLFSFLKWTVQIRTTMRVLEKHVIEFEAHAALRVRVLVRAAFQAVAEGTYITEQVTIESPGIIHGFSAGQGAYAQQEVLKSLRQSFED